MSDIPQQDVDAWIREQKKKGATIVPMGDRVASLQKTITEQMDYKHAILRQIEACQFGLLYGWRPFSTNVIMLINMIPEDDKDDQFNEDVENAKVPVEIKTDKRIDRTWHSRRGHVYTKGWMKDYFALFRACINLFRRRGMLWSETQQEVFR